RTRKPRRGDRSVDRTDRATIAPSVASNLPRKPVNSRHCLALERYPPAAELRRSVQCVVSCTYAGGGWGGTFDTNTKEYGPQLNQQEAWSAISALGQKGDIGARARHVLFGTVGQIVR